MRIENTLALIGTLLFAVGCDEAQRSTTYGTSDRPTYGSSEPVHQGQVLATTPSTSGYSTYPVTTGTYSSQYSSDNELVERVRRELNRYNDLAMVTPTLNISAQNGAVSLGGGVPTESQRQMIHSIARNTTGVVAINDQLELIPPQPSPTYVQSAPTYVQPASSAAPSDQALANQVQQALYSHPTASQLAQ